ncbi:glycoside hydrolase [Microbulbifer agarilyticus]|uniref:Glycoside hydrolase n=1 Tax=Microbulbifer agarilyticus TaxID=260552 RepID=A0A1Q2M3M5_9GAMM|nr:SH3 domain-containing protein [Microbulbifer agarilyticus]AQQ67266.1 glycoside hydrolase [Microbulbifer agarilyticus]
MKFASFDSKTVRDFALVIVTGLTSLVLVSCDAHLDEEGEQTALVRKVSERPEYVSDVPKLTEEMLSVKFWQEKIERDAERLRTDEIVALNTESLTQDSYLHNLADFPEMLARQQVLQLIDQVSRPASAPRYRLDGRGVSEQDYASLEAAVQRTTVPESVEVQWGVVVARASMRSYPTMLRILKNTDDRDLDRFQETGVFPGQRLAILHESADGEWWFAVNYHYAAWLPKRAVAVGERQQINAWHQQSHRVTVSGAQVRTNYNPEDPRTSEVVLDMGVSLPLLTAAEVGHNVNGQNPHASYIVSLPVRDAEGRLEFEPTLIGRGQDVTVGLLEYRPSLVLQQAFKFLGERYGWGHDYNGRDCTGFVGEVYKSFGILMPRNSGQQGKSEFAPTKRFAADDHVARAEALGELQVGDLIYIPGHVMMFIGEVDGEPYVIHDVTGLSYYQSDESFYKGTLSGVSITPLTPLYLNKEKSFVDGIYAIKTII